MVKLPVLISALTGAGITETEVCARVCNKMQLKKMVKNLCMRYNILMIRNDY
jgi:transcriptional regulatory protein LevR